MYLFSGMIPSPETPSLPVVLKSELYIALIDSVCLFGFLFSQYFIFPLYSQHIYLLYSLFSLSVIDGELTYGN